MPCPALPCTLLACGCRDSLRQASHLLAELHIRDPGCCRTSSDISLPGHFSIPNHVVGETQIGGVKRFGNPNTRETRDTHTGFKPLLPGIQGLTFFLRIICLCSVVPVTSWTH